MSVEFDDVLKMRTGKYVSGKMAGQPVRIKLLRGHDEVDVEFPKNSPITTNPRRLVVRMKSDEILYCKDISLC